MALSNTSLGDLGHAACRAFSRPSKFHEFTHFKQHIDIFAQCVKMQYGYLYTMHKGALRFINDTRTKSKNKLKDAIMIPAFEGVYLT